MTNTKLRTALTLALGVADSTDDVEIVLGCALDNLRAEAEVIMSTDLSLSEDSRMALEHAHFYRLKALETMINECVDLRWRGEGPSGVGIPFGGEAAK